MGMNARKRIYLDINPADRARLLASATAYATGRRTYVVGAVSDVIAANAGRLDAAVRETLADAIRPAADAGDSIDAPAWTRALAALETAARRFGRARRKPRRPAHPALLRVPARHGRRRRPVDAAARRPDGA